MKNLIAADSIPLYPSSGFQGVGPLGLEGGPGSAPSVFNNFITGAIGIMTIIAVIWFIFLLVSGAIGIISSGGDKTGLESSKKRITSGIIGLVVIIAAIFIIRLIAALLGIENILNPATFIENFEL